MTPSRIPTGSWNFSSARTRTSALGLWGHVSSIQTAPSSLRVRSMCRKNPNGSTTTSVINPCMMNRERSWSGTCLRSRVPACTSSGQSSWRSGRLIRRTRSPSKTWTTACELGRQASRVDIVRTRRSRTSRARLVEKFLGPGNFSQKQYFGSAGEKCSSIVPCARRQGHSGSSIFGKEQGNRRSERGRFPNISRRSASVGTKSRSPHGQRTECSKASGLKAACIHPEHF